MAERFDMDVEPLTDRDGHSGDQELAHVDLLKTH